MQLWAKGDLFVLCASKTAGGIDQTASPSQGSEATVQQLELQRLYGAQPWHAGLDGVCGMWRAVCEYKVGKRGHSSRMRGEEQRGSGCGWEVCGCVGAPVVPPTFRVSIRSGSRNRFSKVSQP